MPPYPLTDFRIQKSRSKLSGVFLRNKVTITRDIAFIISFGKCKSIGTQ